MIANSKRHFGIYTGGVVTKSAAFTLGRTWSVAACRGGGEGTVARVRSSPRRDGGLDRGEREHGPERRPTVRPDYVRSQSNDCLVLDVFHQAAVPLFPIDRHRVAPRLRAPEQASWARTESSSPLGRDVIAAFLRRLPDAAAISCK